jgi:putative membrane protein
MPVQVRPVRIWSVPQDARFPCALLAGFAVFWVALAIAPRYRADWLLENVLVFAAVPGLVLAWRNLRFSNAAYLCLFVFLVLHTIGAHYTYSEVPYDQWFASRSGWSFDALFGFERNHYDRLVHFLYGALLMPATIELFAAKAPPRGVWIFWMPVMFIMSHSVIYETIEWLAAEVFGGDLGTAYLGTQGDEWDAHKDMALAAAGALLSRLAILHWWPSPALRSAAG